MSDLMTARQVSEYLQRSYPRTVELLGAEIPATKLGGQWRVRLADVDAFIDKGRTTSKPRRRGRVRLP